MRAAAVGRSSFTEGVEAELDLRSWAFEMLVLYACWTRAGIVVAGWLAG